MNIDTDALEAELSALIDSNFPGIMGQEVCSDAAASAVMAHPVIRQALAMYGETVGWKPHDWYYRDSQRGENEYHRRLMTTGHHAHPVNPIIFKLTDQFSGETRMEYWNYGFGRFVQVHDLADYPGWPVVELKYADNNKEDCDAST